MNPYVLLSGLLLFLFCALNLVINYIARRNRETKPAWKTEIWAIPILSLLILGQITGFAFLYMTFFQSLENTSTLIRFSAAGDLFTFSVFILLSFLLFETFIHPLTVAAARTLLKRPLSFFSKQLITIVADWLLIYFFASLIPGVYLQDFLSALTISVVFHIIEWLLTGFAILYKKSRNKDIHM
ncbi:hypothetical protein [Paenibacillus lutrae]|uniref:Uncharacterized protein n=1 Tax=Paenibacillus lutrae TaxID=2078573 RepID=A0A7X3FHM8_9BACL|nr:hypothetical protein [Paenibacillus lutrae]MVO99800.1 hypothetical protein [Paenibacillus lutrae]